MTAVAQKMYSKVQNDPFTQVNCGLYVQHLFSAQAEGLS